MNLETACVEHRHFTNWCLRFSLGEIFFLINLLIFIFWLWWVFVNACRLSLVVASGGLLFVEVAGFSLQWLLLQSTGSRHVSFSRYGSWAQ